MSKQAPCNPGRPLTMGIMLALAAAQAGPRTPARVPRTPALGHGPAHNLLKRRCVPTLAWGLSAHGGWVKNATLAP